MAAAHELGGDRSSFALLAAWADSSSLTLQGDAVWRQRRAKRVVELDRLIAVHEEAADAQLDAVTGMPCNNCGLIEKNLSLEESLEENSDGEAGVCGGGKGRAGGDSKRRTGADSSQYNLGPPSTGQRMSTLLGGGMFTISGEVMKATSSLTDVLVGPLDALARHPASSKHPA